MNDGMPVKATTSPLMSPSAADTASAISTAAMVLLKIPAPSLRSAVYT